MESLENQTWDSLFLKCATLPAYKGQFFFVKGTIEGEGSSSGQVVLMVNRLAWQTLWLPIGYFHGKVSGGSVQEKTGSMFDSTPYTFPS
jgi:hypothetical protein